MTTTSDPQPILVAAIDAGSNGIRFAIGRVETNGAFRKLENIRESVRLGADAFTHGQFSEATFAAAAAAFERFAGLMRANGIEHYRAVATSATRDTANGKDLVAHVLAATGIQIEIIDGLEEAHLVFAGVAAEVDLLGKTSLLVDMGGGSVEITVARDGVALGCLALPMGGVRLLSQMRAAGKSERDLEELLVPFQGAAADLIRTQLKKKPVEVCVATGGNPNALGRLRVALLGKSKIGKVKLSDLDSMIELLLGMTPQERETRLELRPDRADVIAIAAIVLRMIMREAEVGKALTPGVGLAEGLLRQVAARVRR